MSSILLNIGASTNFVGPMLLQQLGISYTSYSSATLRLAHHHEAPISSRMEDISPACGPPIDLPLPPKNPSENIQCIATCSREVS